jgi:hypothetical protein
VPNRNVGTVQAKIIVNSLGDFGTGPRALSRSPTSDRGFGVRKFHTPDLLRDRIHSPGPTVRHGNEMAQAANAHCAVSARGQFPQELLLILCPRISRHCIELIAAFQPVRGSIKLLIVLVSRFVALDEMAFVKIQ